jgi:integrase
MIIETALANPQKQDPIGRASAEYLWLRSDYSSPVWCFVPHIETDEKSRYTVRWFVDEEDERPWGWSYWVDKAKEQVVWRMERAERVALATSSLALYTRNIRNFFRFLCVERHCTALKDVSQWDVEAYKNSLVSRRLSKTCIENYLIPVADSYLMKEISRDALGFDPFCNIGLYRFSSSNSNPGGHTKTLLPRETFFLLNEALRIVKNSDKTLCLFDSYMEIRNRKINNKKELETVSKIFEANHKSSSQQLLDDIRILYGAAISITFLLLAERKHEAGLRESSDVTRILNEELDILYGLEKKTSGTVVGKRTEVAVVDEVKMALRVIMRLTRHTRVASGKSKVLLKLPVYHNACSGSKKSYYLHTVGIYGLLDRFVKSTGLSIKLRPHMFRRAYAMLWMWRYEIGELEELSQMLKHNNDVFTRRYTDDEDIWDFMPDAEKQMTFDILNDAYLKKMKVGGGGSETLERFGRLIQAKSRLLDPENIAVIITDLIAKEGVEIISHAEGYCVITDLSKGQSKCLDGDGQLIESKREETRCVGCPNFVIDDSRRGYWEKRIALHQRVVDSSQNSNLVYSSRKFIREAMASLANLESGTLSGAVNSQ